MSLVSLIMLCAVALAWVRVQFASDTFGMVKWKDESNGVWCGRGFDLENNSIMIYSFYGTHIFEDPHRAPADSEIGMQPHVFHRKKKPRASAPFFEWKERAFSGIGGSNGYFNVFFARWPLWLPSFVFMVMPAWFVASKYIKRRKPGPGMCKGCFYDLRGNVSGICPECGITIGG